jgi:hypothetical protein
MTLTLADLDRWDPNAIHGVFQVAIDRASGVRSTATQIGDVMATTPWEGDSHDVAMLDQFGIDMNTAVDGYREYYEHSTRGK